MKRSEVRIGMVSWAHIHAQFRARALSEIPGAVVVAVSDDNRPRGEKAAKEFGAEFVTDWRDLVSRPDIDVVMVHSENSRHPDQVIEAARAGKHVFCEKPVATDVQDAEKMVAAIEQAGVDGTAAFVSRFSKEASRASEVMRSGAIGDVLFTRSFIGLKGLEEIGLPDDMVAWMADPGCVEAGLAKVRGSSSTWGTSATSPRSASLPPIAQSRASGSRTWLLRRSALPTARSARWSPPGASTPTSVCATTSRSTAAKEPSS